MSLISAALRVQTDHYTFLGNCPPTPPLSQHFVLSEKYELMLAWGMGMWAVSRKVRPSIQVRVHQFSRIAAVNRAYTLSQ